MPKISFIIPALNSQETIASCIESVLLQQGHEFESEVLVVDNGSTDSTVKIARSFSSVEVIIENVKSRSRARQTGLDSSSGNYIAFVDSDVILSPNWAKNLINYFLLMPQIGAAQGKIEPLIEKKWQLIQWHHTRFRTFGTFNLVAIIGENKIPVIDTAASMWRRKAIRDGFSLDLIRAEDVDLTMRVLYKGFSLLGIAESHAFVRWDKGFFKWLYRYFDQASSEKKVYKLWGFRVPETKLINILRHPLWGSLPFIVQLIDLLLISLYKVGQLRKLINVEDTYYSQYKNQNPLYKTFVNDQYFLGKGFRSIFLNEYVALINIKTLKCIWVYKDETKWSQTLVNQLVQKKIIYPRKD